MTARNNSPSFHEPVFMEPPCDVIHANGGTTGHLLSAAGSHCDVTPVLIPDNAEALEAESQQTAYLHDTLKRLPRTGVSFCW